MIKGCHKRIIFLKNTESELFEEAYFIMKPSATTKSHKDVVEEATKIVNDLEPTKSKTKKHSIFGRLIWFLSGLCAGSGAVLLIFTLT